MRTVHFTELRHLKVTGEPKLGERYLKCHDSRSHAHSMAGSAYAEEIVVAGPLTMERVGSRLASKFPYIALRERPTYLGVLRKLPTAFAADCGITDVPGGGNNSSNFLLDIAELRRQGIEVDTTMIPRTAPAPRYDRYDDDYDYDYSDFYCCRHGRCCC